MVLEFCEEGYVMACTQIVRQIDNIYFNACMVTFCSI